MSSQATATCRNCDAQFVPKNKYKPSKTCSKECRYALSAATNRTVQGRWVTKRCPACGVEFDHSASNPKETCSVQCRGKLATLRAREARTCSQCGTEFTHYHRQEQNTCSVKCAAQARSEGKKYPQCEVCGVLTGGYDRVFCDAHRGSRRGRKPMPRKVAICLGCGEQFSRPGYWSGKMKYCSNRCSHRQVKSVRDKYIADLPEGAVVFHSGWEVRFWACCLRLDIPIRSYDGPDIETSVGVYRPDFIVGPDELVVDVKGWTERPGTAEKLAGSGVHMIGRKELAALESATDPTEGIVILRKAAA